MFFSKILKYIPDSGLSRFPLSVSVSVYTMTGQTPALQQNLQSSEKSQYFKENTIFNEHPVQKLYRLLFPNVSHPLYYISFLKGQTDEN